LGKHGIVALLRARDGIDELPNNSITYIYRSYWLLNGGGPFNLSMLLHIWILALCLISQTLHGYDIIVWPLVCLIFYREHNATYKGTEASKIENIMQTICGNIITSGLSSSQKCYNITV